MFFLKVDIIRLSFTNNLNIAQKKKYIFTKVSKVYIRRFNNSSYYYQKEACEQNDAKNACLQNTL